MLGRLEVRILSIRSYYVQILVGLLFALLLSANLVLASDPTEYDKDFLFGDPDGDEIPTWEELIIGSDPYNADSDNDGLPDYWEYYIAEMDLTDASDAHLDYDYYPASEFSLGERDSEFGFRAIKREIDVWPAIKNTSFTKLVLDEDGIHYDNYEEYYRSYIDEKDGNKQKLMSTNPRDSDSDDDDCLDPDDFYPLDNRYKNDSVYMNPSGKNEQTPDFETEPDTSDLTINLDLPTTNDPLYRNDPETFDIQINRIYMLDEVKLKQKNVETYLTDIDNDGF
jgi:hypothetical protein